MLEEAKTIFRDNYAQRPELAAQPENWLGTILVLQKEPAIAEELMLKGADQFLAPTAELSPNERREGVNHVIQLYQALGRPEKAAEWERRLGEFLSSPATLATPAAASSTSAKNSAN